MTDLSEQLVDEVLVMECQRGNAKALDMLISRWQKRLWCYVYRLTGRSEAAWEATQDAWLGIVRGIGRLQEPARFRSWAYRIATNKAHDWTRSNPRAPQEEATGRAAGGNPDTAQSLEASIDLRAILRRLPDARRTVLTLYYLEGFGVAEMAAILRIPAGTVKSRLHTARGEFKTLWQSMSETEGPQQTDKRKEHPNA